MQRYYVVSDYVTTELNDDQRKWGWVEVRLDRDVQALAQEALASICKCGCADELIEKLRAVVEGK